MNDHRRSEQPNPSQQQSNQDKLHEFLTDPSNIAEAVEGSMAKRQALIDAQQSSEVEDIAYALMGLGVLARDADVTNDMREAEFEKCVQKLHQHLATEVNKVLDRHEKFCEYNKHNMGEIGEFVRLQYIKNSIDQERQALERSNQ